MLKLSIITTLYNSAPYMCRCVDSLIEQDLQKDEYEIILVNDASPDNSLEIAESYAKKHGNIHVLSYTVNKGLAGARQFGTDAAQGEFMCYVDPDDYIKPNSLNHLLKKMEEENLDILRFNYQMVDENYTFIDKPKAAQLIDYSPLAMDGKEFLCKRLGYGCYVWAYIYRSKIIKDNDIKFCQGDYFDDATWLPKVLCAAKRVDTIDEARYFYLQRQGSLVNTMTDEATKSKLNGQLVLVRKLSEQWMFQKDIVWYKEMVSRLTMSMLTDVACRFYEQRGKFISELRKNNVFPIRSSKIPAKARIKYWLINISPELFCTLVHFSNK
ncbi:MAG: glycosyltransferase [archaeon]|nr:glycosyltransferase [archaeon]